MSKKRISIAAILAGLVYLLEAAVVYLDIFAQKIIVGPGMLVVIAIAGYALLGIGLLFKQSIIALIGSAVLSVRYLTDINKRAPIPFQGQLNNICWLASFAVLFLLCIFWICRAHKLLCYTWFIPAVLAVCIYPHFSMGQDGIVELYISSLFGLEVLLPVVGSLFAGLGMLKLTKQLPVPEHTQESHEHPLETAAVSHPVKADDVSEIQQALHVYEQMFAEGIITEDELTAKKNELLNH